MSAYSSALQNVALAGPTLFGPVVNRASHLASESAEMNERKYFVLLIITVGLLCQLSCLISSALLSFAWVPVILLQDGVITDLQETKDAIVNASDLPLSILIIGVGGSDFKEMEVLL